MKTNKFFSLKRFYHLLCSDFRFNGRRYLFALAGGVIVVYLLILFNMSMFLEFAVDDYVSLFYVCAFGLCCLTGSMLPEFSSRIRTGNYLLLPASTFEKALSQFLIYIVFAILAFLLVFWVDTYLARCSILQATDREIVIEKFNYSALFQTMNNITVYMAISVGMFLFAVRLFFKRFALIKSVILLVTMILVNWGVMVLLSHIFYPQGTEGFEIALPYYELASGLTNATFYWSIIAYSIWVFSLPIAYYKLKEKQV